MEITIQAKSFKHLQDLEDHFFEIENCRLIEKVINNETKKYLLILNIAKD